MQMLNEINGKERTKEEYEELGRKSGWGLRRVWKVGKGEEGEDVFRHYEFEKLSEGNGEKV